MKHEIKTDGMLNGFVRPRPGEGFYMCRKCGERFHRHINDMDLFDRIGLPLVKCPKCGSFSTKRDERWVH